MQTEEYDFRQKRKRKIRHARFYGQTVQVGATAPGDYTVPMDLTAPTDVPVDPSEVEPSIFEQIVSAPGNLVAANLKPIEKEVAATVANVGQSASATVKGVTGPLIPVLVIAGIAAVGYMYFKSKGSSVNINTAGW